jgi:hypothetical protein
MTITKRTPLVQPPADKALQFTDMPGKSQRNLSSQVRKLGNQKTDIKNQQARLQRAADNPQSSEKTRTKARQRLTSQSALAATLVNAPITHESAAANRVGLVERGNERSVREGTNAGHGWYFEHHKKLADVAAATGNDRYKVIAASAVMSPQNNPEQELSAVTALTRMHADPKARIKVPEAALAHPDAPSSLRDWVGKSVHPSKLSPIELAHISTASLRSSVKTKGDVDLGSVSKGGVKGNVIKAIDVLRGNTPVEKAIDPRSSPKVWSYHHNIASSVYGSPEHTEFAERMHTTTGREVSGQTRMDLFGLKSATHGPLDPRGPTAEDTWQQAISTGQQLKAINIPGRQGRAALQSPAKFSVGEGGSANQKMLRSVPGMVKTGVSALMHAWQNRATHLAAETLSHRTGEIIPAIGVQAGGWTEGRREAGKAIEENVKQGPQRKQPEQMSMFHEDMSVNRRALPAKSKRQAAFDSGQGALF